MNVLGLSDCGASGSHDTSAALICDGTLVAVAEEERFTREKHESRAPLFAADFCLRRAGLRMSQVDVLAIPDLPFRSGRNSYLGSVDLSFVKRLRAGGAVRFRSVLHKRILDFILRSGIEYSLGLVNSSWESYLSTVRARYGVLPPVRYFDHHLAHAATAYYTSGYERASVLTVDGFGGLCATVSWRVDRGQFSRIQIEPYTNSLGLFYEDCTRYLGLGGFGEGKMMGLASYGNAHKMDAQVSSMLDTTGSRWYSYRDKPSPELLGFDPRKYEFINGPPYNDFAAAAQAALQRAVHRVAQSTVETTGLGDLCLGGGVALNCSSNGALWCSGLASSISVFPASGDSGLSLGACLLCAAEAGEVPTRIEHAYWGPEFSPVEYERALLSHAELEFRKSIDLPREVAELLAQGEVIGWFQGRMELGPRALGNRSILADPRSEIMRDRVNRIKGREMWRPLAPAVLADSAQEYFQLPGLSPFMLFAVQVCPDKKSLIPAVVHVDGSARPQTVTRQQNPVLYEVLLAFSEITGIPVLLNTSFNLAGEPIVCSPEDAIKTFLSSELDALILGEYISTIAGADQAV